MNPSDTLFVDDADVCDDFHSNRKDPEINVAIPLYGSSLNDPCGDGPDHRHTKLRRQQLLISGLVLIATVIAGLSFVIWILNRSIAISLTEIPSSQPSFAPSTTPSVLPTVSEVVSFLSR